MILRLTLLLTAALCGAACSRTSPELVIVNDALEAMGGRSVVEGVRTLTMVGSGTSGNLGQNRVPSADNPSTPAPQNSFVDLSELTRSVDFVNGRARQVVTRTPKFPSPNPQPNTERQSLDGNVAFTVSANGVANRQPAAAAITRRREFLLHHPVGILRAALDPAATLSNARHSGEYELVDITTAQGDTVTLSIASESRLPVAVSNAAYHNYLGDVVNETQFFDYEDVNGVQLPTRFMTKVDQWPGGEVRVRNTVNAAADDLEAPQSVDAAPEPAPQTVQVLVEQVAPWVWYLTGAAHNSVLVEFSDHTELIEVPNGDARALAVIDRARALVPGKPLTKAIVTHHHFDHSGGIRAAISQGLTLVTHEMNAPFFQEVARRQHTLGQDALAKNPDAPKIETIGDQLVVRDAMRNMAIYRFDDPTGHNDGMLIVHLPGERILINADLYNWGGNFTAYPRVVALGADILRRGISVNIHLPVHGRKSLHSDFMRVHAAVVSGRRPEGLREE